MRVIAFALGLIFGEVSNMIEALMVNVRKSARMFSNHVAIILAMGAAYWLQLSPEHQAEILAQYPKLKHAMPWLSFVIWYIARMIPQKSVT